MKVRIILEAETNEDSFPLAYAAAVNEARGWIAEAEAGDSLLHNVTIVDVVDPAKVDKPVMRDQGRTPSDRLEDVRHRGVHIHAEGRSIAAERVGGHVVTNHPDGTPAIVITPNQ
jgi:riboflavin synthase alpha subunit